jgi:lytic murein transglycosylase
MALAAFGLVTAVGPQAGADVSFQSFVAGLWPDAQKAGVSRVVFDEAMRGVTPDMSLPDLERAGEPKSGGGQAEFTKTPLEYLNLALLQTLAERGRKLAIEHQATLAAVEKRLGVPPPVTLAIWGRETAYGAHKLKHDAIRVLATQAFAGRRKDVFRGELIAALKMLEDRIATRATMRASWAGAMGLTQFMPTEFYSTALDFDGNGRADLFTSVPDALGSAANQLKMKGWQAGKPWGFEVRLAAGRTCLDEGLPNRRLLQDWVGLGLVRADGKAFPGDLMREQAFILMPAGTHGPAFVAFENFLVLKRYNFADLYALFVGHLGDRIAGGGAFVGRWTSPKMLATRDIEDIQDRLKRQGYPIEKIDGKAGMNTLNQIGRYQQAHKLALDCWPSVAVLTHLRSVAP